MRVVAAATIGGLALLLFSGNLGVWLADRWPEPVSYAVFNIVNLVACAVLGAIVGARGGAYWPAAALPIVLYHLTIGAFVLHSVMLWHVGEFLLWVAVTLASAWLFRRRVVRLTRGAPGNNRDGPEGHSTRAAR